MSHSLCLKFSIFRFLAANDDAGHRPGQKEIQGRNVGTPPHVLCTVDNREVCDLLSVCSRENGKKASFYLWRMAQSAAVQPQQPQHPQKAHFTQVAPGT